MNRYGYAPGYGNRGQQAAAQQQQQIGPQPQPGFQQQTNSHAPAQAYDQQVGQAHGYDYSQQQAAAGWDATAQGGYSAAAQTQPTAGYSQPAGASQYQQQQQVRKGLVAPPP